MDRNKISAQADADATYMDLVLKGAAAAASQTYEEVAADLEAAERSRIAYLEQSSVSGVSAEREKEIRATWRRYGSITDLFRVGIARIRPDRSITTEIPKSPTAPVDYYAYTLQRLVVDGRPVFRVICEDVEVEDVDATTLQELRL